MSDPQTFGLRLRRERERRRISIEELAAATKVGADLWEGLERNDLSRWPSGIFARAFLRDYARTIGLDAEELVDEFCRLYPQGDRRASRLIRAQAELIGHDPIGVDDPHWMPVDRDRRAPASSPSEYLKLAPRAIAATVDISIVLLLSATWVLLFDTSFWASAGLMALVYHTLSTLLDASPGKRVAAELRQRVPTLFPVDERRRATA
jgi:transcriptional regulator with XRE-family HTH domain